MNLFLFFFLLILFSMGCILLTIKLYITFSTRWNSSPVCLVGKTAIVTGSNIGIGYYTALEFAKRGAKVILACRDQIKAETAKQRIIEETGNKNVFVRILDLSSLDSVRQFAKNIINTEDRLDILVNNAGCGGFAHSFTDDGLSLTMQSNHFGPFLLTILLIGLLKKSKSSRIVTVSSDAAGQGDLDIENLNAPSKTFPKYFDYANSKLCNLLFTIKLAQELKGSEVTANVLHPGCAQSDIFKDTPCIFTKFFSILMKLLFASAEAGAQTSIYLAIAKEMAGVSGKFFINCAEAKYPRSAQNKVLTDLLWEKSKEMVKLTEEEYKHL